MYKKLIILTLMALSLNAANHFYIGANGGYNFQDKNTLTNPDNSSKKVEVKHDDKIEYGGTIGYKYKFIAIETAYSSTSAKIKSGISAALGSDSTYTTKDTSVDIFSVNLLLSLNFNKSIINSIYVGSGYSKFYVAGTTTTIKAGGVSIDTKSDKFEGYTFPLIVGIDGMMGKNILWDIRYRFEALADGNVKIINTDVESGAYKISSVTFGFSLLF